MRKLVAPRETYQAASGSPNPNNSSGSGASIPPPVGGWDAISPLAAMPPTRAVLMDNWFPQPGYVEVRRGYGFHRDTSISGAVETLMVYQGPVVQRLFAATRISASSALVTDCTTASPAPGGGYGVPQLTVSNARLQYINFTTTGGNFLQFVNGADAPRYYNGGVWATAVITGSAGTAMQINAFKNRIWYIPVNSTSPEYLPVDSIQGAVTAFPLGGLLTQGGYIVDMATWSIDAGDGPDDYAVFISSRGQVIIYSGIDPATDFLLVGVYDLAPPIGTRCMEQYGADIAIITLDGVFLLSQSLIERSSQSRTALTGNIQRVMNQSARTYGTIFGWQLQTYPRGTRLILNVPISENTTYHQYVMNTITGAWCRFIGMDAISWAVMGERLFFGSYQGYVFEADIGGTDYGRSLLTATFQTAYNYYDTPGQLKQWTLCQPLLNVGNFIDATIAINVDFRDDGFPAQIANVTSALLSLWDTAEWDDALWGGGTVAVTNWNSIVGVGQCASVEFNLEITHPGGDVTIAGPATPYQVMGFNMFMRSGGGIM